MTMLGKKDGTYVVDPEDGDCGDPALPGAYALRIIRAGCERYLIKEVGRLCWSPMTTPDPNEIAKQAREHAWNWFALHATQRMQAFNFFVVATAFLALVGAWLTFWFNRLDARSYQLVEAGEDALRVSQARLARLADNQSLMILDAVDEPAPGASSYRRGLRNIPK
jgi:hypothetical protein